jgi:hypothetical protein
VKIMDVRVKRYSLPPDGPGLGLELDDAVAAAALVPEQDRGTS